MNKHSFDARNRGQPWPLPPKERGSENRNIYAQATGTSRRASTFFPGISIDRPSLIRAIVRYMQVQDKG